MKRSIILVINLTIVIGALTQSPDTYDKEVIGNTFYDLQTWRAMQNRLYVFGDGTIGLVWNFSEFGSVNTGVGYGYYDGNQWNGSGASIASGWAVFPSYTAYGENGEICFSQGETGLIMSTREEKGTGDWVEVFIEESNYKHPVVATSWVDNQHIQLLCLDPDTSLANSAGQAYRGPILYSKSIDGGATWDPDNSIIDGIGQDEYLGFTIGSYCWADPVDNILAFVAGDYYTDLVLMKSIDGGNTWQKTVIWEHPYPFFEPGTFNSDTFYCNDGGVSVVLDGSGKAHVSFPLTRVHSSITQDSLWFDYETDGIVYWNEDRAVFSDNINALNPYGHPDSELIEDYSLIGWSQDINGNGELDILDSIGRYPTPGLSTMSQIAISDWGTIVVAWSSVTETYDNGIANYRHIWGRLSNTDGNNWGDFHDFNDDLIFIFSENVYPVLAKDFDSEDIFLSFQEDSEPGLSGDEPLYNENKIWFYPEFIGWIPTTVQANFTCDTTVVHEGDFVEFTNLSVGYPPDLITYEWEFEGGNPGSSTTTDPVVEYTEAGTYDVKLTAFIEPITSNVMIEEDYITVLPALEMDENGRRIAEIYPNPTTGLLYVSIPLQKDYSIKISDPSGKLIYGPILLMGPVKNSINLSDVPKGIIFIEVTSDEKIEVKKIVLK